MKSSLRKELERELENERLVVAALDQEILCPLLDERVEHTDRIGDIKNRLGMSVCSPKVEERKLAGVKRKSRNSNFVCACLAAIMAASRDEQEARRRRRRTTKRR